MATLWRRYGKGSAHPYEGLPLVLVSGVGRSGTTALWQALSRHPALHGTGNENNIIFDVLETARHNCTYPSRRATMHVAPPAYDRQFRLLLLNLLWPQPRRGAARPRMLLATSDLTPPRAEYLPRLFPAAHIVYIVRNGIEVVSSRMTHSHFADVAFDEHCRIWCLACSLAEWGQDRSTFLLVRHEELLQPDSARRVIGETLARLGLPHCQSCVDTITGGRFHPTRFHAEREAASGDLAQRQERWRLWSEEQRRTFSTLCSDAMRFFGYRVPWN